MTEYQASKKKTRISGIDNLVRESIRVNKKSVSMPISTWELIDVILKKIKIQV